MSSISQLGLLVKVERSDRHLNLCFSFLGCCIKLMKLLDGAKLKGLGKHLNKQQIRGMRRKVLFITKRWMTSFVIFNPFILVIACMRMKLQFEWVQFWLKMVFTFFTYFCINFSSDLDRILYYLPSFMFYLLKCSISTSSSSEDYGIPNRYSIYIGYHWQKSQ